MSQLFRTVAHAVFRQRMAFLIAFLAVLAAATAASVLLQPVWRARAIIALSRSTDAPDGLDLLASHDLYRRIIDRIGADKLYPGLDAEDAVQAFAHDFSAAERQGELVEVAYDGRDPKLAAETVDAALKTFGGMQTRLRIEAANSVFDQQEKAYKAALADARQRLDSYRQANNLAGADDERRQLIRSRTELEADLQRTIAAENDLAGRIRGLKSQMDQPVAVPDGADQGTRYKVVDEAKGRLLELQLKEQELLSKYQETSQFVITVRDEIRRVKAFLDGMASSINDRAKAPANDMYGEWSKNLTKAETQMNSAQAHHAQLEAKLGEIDGRINDIEARQGQLRQLSQAVAENETNIQRIEESRTHRTADAGKEAGMTVIAPPTPPSAALWPNPPLYFGLGLPIGLLCGLGAALLAQAASSTFAEPREVERRLGLPVLAALPAAS